jgi:hypothetical protein
MTPLGLGVPSPADGAQAAVAGMSNDQLLQLADTREGAAALRGMATTMRQGTITPERQAQLDRIDAATFTPAGGLKLQGSDADKHTYLSMVRRTMLESPSFAKTMKETNADSKHPVNIKLERDTGTMLDSFNRQALDLSDLEQLPAKPSAEQPEAITQGSVLAHMMREQREKALQPDGAKDIGPAHRAAIESENDYRRDIGQTSMRKLPPDDENRITTPFGTMIQVNFDNDQHQTLFFDANGKFNGSAGYTGPGLVPDAPSTD